MRFGVRHWAAVLLALGLTTVTACSTDGTATRGPIDLDTGKYTKAASPGIPESAFDKVWPRTESARLADHLVFPKEVDPVLVSTALPTMPLPAASTTTIVVPGLDKQPVMQNYRYGFTVSNGDGTGDVGFNHALFAFDSPASATEAAKAIRDTIDADKENTTDHKTDPIACAPAGTQALQQNLSSIRVALGATPVGSTVIYSYASSKDPRQSASIVASALTKQKALLDVMPAMSQSKNPDPTGLLRGTLRDEDDNSLSMNVYGPRAAAALLDDAPAAYAAMRKAGVDAIAINGTDAYRAGGEAQAKDWMDFLYANELSNTDDAKKAASPRDLSSARCWEEKRQAQCYIAIGRYVGTASASTLLDAQQQISAQSVLLAKLAS